MEAAQKRLDEQREKGTEMPLEDVKGPEGAESFESPRTTLRATVQGSEERPKGSPKSLGPPVPESSPKPLEPPKPAEDEPKVPPAKAKVTPVQTPSQVKAEVRTPEPAAGGSSSEVQTALVPASTDLMAATIEQNVTGVSHGPQPAQIDSAQRQSQQLVSPSQPRFDDQQVRRFHEMFQQAPWLYPGAQMMAPPVHVQPAIARPLFLEQEERRMYTGDQPPLGYPMVPGIQETMEFRRGLEMMMEENKKLREKVEMFEKLRSDDDQKFSTPDSNQKEVETKQETMKFPPNVQGSQSSTGIGTTKEAARPPLGFQGFPKEAETPKATVRPQKVEAEESKGVRTKEAETT